MNLRKDIKGTTLTRTLPEGGVVVGTEEAEVDLLTEEDMVTVETPGARGPEMIWTVPRAG